MNQPSRNATRPHFLHGGDYSPEQWPREVWQRDMELMKKAGCTTLSLGIFAWTALEPEEGRYTFEWLDEAMDLLARHGHQAVLATPTAAPPIWMATRYPEIRRVEEDGGRYHPGNRVNFCPTSPTYRTKVAELDRRLAERYAGHPALLLWHVSNEFCFHCYCDACQEAFRAWLRERYGSLDALNRAWWSAFWSQTFTDWSQIEPPGGKRIMSLEGLHVDWYRFQTAQTVAFMQAEIDVLKAADPRRPVTTNLMGTHVYLDYTKFAPALDVVSYDAYPSYHDRPDNPRTASEQSFHFDLQRSLKGGRPWLLMETTPSSCNWMAVMKLKRPGVHRQTALQAVAHGADGVLYFQWRKGLGGREKLHGAVVDHASDAESRVFREVADLGRELAQMDAVLGTTTRAEVAVVYDWENRWAIDATCGPRKQKKDYLETCLAHYHAFWRRGIPVDVVNMDVDFSSYRVVVAPMLHMVRKGVGERLTQFVENGGTLVTSYWSGVVDDSALCFQDGVPGPLRRVLGIRSEELDVLYDDETCRVEGADGGPLGAASFEARIFCDLIHAEGAEVAATYAQDFYAGRPALTVHRFGKGRAWYQAFRGDDAFLDRFYGVVEQEAGLRRVLAAELPEGVTAQVRSDGQREFVFVLNCTNRPQTLALRGEKLTDFFTKAPVPPQLDLAPYDTRVLVREGHPCRS